MDELLWDMVKLENDRVDWYHRGDRRLWPVTKHIHGPLMQKYMAELDLQDPDLVADLQYGCRQVGCMPQLDYNVVTHFKTEETLGIGDLVAARRVVNDEVLRNVKATELDEQVFESTVADAKEGWMSPPVELTSQHVQDNNLTRRIPVLEWRELLGRLRLRVVGHFAESWINWATFAHQRLQSDTLDMVVWAIHQLLLACMMPLLFNADVASAYRRVPVHPDDWCFTGTVFSAFGKMWFSAHRSCPFGALASVWHFHRVANFILRFMRTKMMFIIMKFVDDFFGVCREGLSVSPTVALDVACSAFGFSLDGRKSVSMQVALTIIGARLTISWMKKAASLAVDETKRKRRLREIDYVLESKIMCPALAEKIIGRFG